jgi:hypothetical protein
MPTVPPTAWQRFSAASVRSFHAYANWLVGISWKRFFVLSLLLLIFTGVVQSLPPFTWTHVESVTESPRVQGMPKPPTPPGEGAIKIEKPRNSGKGTVEITIDERGVRIVPRAKPAASAASAPSSSASDGVHIALPPGANSEAVIEAVEEARQAVIEAIQESADASSNGESTEIQIGNARRRVTKHQFGNFLPTLAFVWIVASMMIKITYKGRIQAEVKAAQATETAESESLKRQVVEARMAAMQAQVEPHFLFNTLASIDHLIETDPPRASTMQKNLIALLRASMPAMRESHPLAHNLGRELAVIRPYLEILKVRMEDRLHTEVNVPDGLLSAEFPSMMIQSLVENAIKHGLEPKPEGGTLTLRAEIIHGKLAVTVADTGLGFGKAATAGTGVGLNNIRQRLQLLYGSKASMTVAENSPSGTVVTLVVPYLAQTSDAEGA